ncbi:Signal transduction histidine kinase [Enhydrobacter aerosaccus]|uniref:histidine kinase n=1 Tax=Enhydrobacter aerosaccus TaxID=225324 RepID=A0A1T4KA71_9HYPH|nr:ATP-binding protein [Enhydrobacter aerosaccus]SJZ39358.1 Signal transduction histidine kinase [Enhydrobacter aerosaccus]
MRVLTALGLTNRIATQIVVLLVLAGLAAWAAIVSIILTVAPEFELSPMATRHAATIAAILRGLETVPAADRRILLSAYQADELNAAFIPEKPERLQRALNVPKRLQAWVEGQLPSGIRVLGVYEDGKTHIAVIVALTDGQLVAFRLIRDPQLRLAFPVILMAAFFGASIALLLGWALRRLVAPLSRFAAAADRFGGEAHEASLKEEGPEEIRRATRAFNRMQQRIQRLIEDRTRMLMAISHDLRTPLTRLRLRIEESAEDASKQRMLDDVALMNTSIESAIAYVREGGATEATELTDLPTLVQTICSQFEDAGHVITYDGPSHLDVHCQPLALERAIANLIDNAVKFGGSIVVRLRMTPANQVVIEVEDDGPGIPDAEKSRVVEPFYRSDQARRTVGGFGMGLAIAVTVARHHNGTLTLHDRVPHGLCARLTIPVFGPLGSDRA